MPSDEFLRTQSKRLLEQLREKQKTLGKAVTVARNGRLTDQEDTLSLSYLDSGNITKAKESLCSRVDGVNSNSLSKHARSDSQKVTGQGVKKLTQGVITLNNSVQKVSEVPDPCKDVYQTEDLNSYSSCTTPVKTETGTSGRITTPTSVRRGRQIIDRNVRVESSKIHRESDHGTYVLSTDRSTSHRPHSLSGRSLDLPKTESNHHRQITGDEDMSHGQREYSEEENNSYYKKLTDGGNDRKMVNFIKEATIKPKSILNNAGPHGAKKRNGSFSRVSFHDNSSNGRTSPSFMEDKTSRQLLGYDWIAGLIDNDPSIIDQSEAFFEELRDFRRVNREECENRAYMEGPLSIRGAIEPSVVHEALQTKVKPFTVNDRLFTVPIKNNLLASYVGEPTEDTVENREPSYDAPRFVRVSIPRSTLSTPHRYKPHRRRSFDPTDSMALGEHCLLGWESSRPASLPTASNIALKDASKGIKSHIATTLEEAEKVASSFYWPNSGPPGKEQTDRRVIKDSLFQQRYNSLLEGLQSKGGYPDIPVASLPDTSLSTAGDSIQFSYSLPKSGKPSTSFSQSSDKLLNSTYSLIYEMERLKQEADARLNVPAV